MKNIHVLATDKQSRFYSIDGKHKLANSTMAMDWYISSVGYKPHNIYITSNEEIKEGNYITDSYLIWRWKDDSSLLGRKKIILTTDQDLIKDGVQAIDDEFLEWFVKNPSCEWVDVELFPNFTNKLYGILIPKEEPKQDLEKEMFDLEQELDIPLHLRWHNSKPKQERMYSEKEVKHIVSEALESALVTFDLEQWFEQFKNK